MGVRSLRLPRLAWKSQVGCIELVPPQERAVCIVRLERNAAVVAGSAHPNQPELALRDERAGHDIRISGVSSVDARGRARGKRTRREFVERIRTRALDFQKLAEMPVAGDEQHTLDPRADKPLGERVALVLVPVPAFEARAAVPELPARRDDL